MIEIGQLFCGCCGRLMTAEDCQLSFRDANTGQPICEDCSDFAEEEPEKQEATD